ncbi:hypothetical protein B0T09DRAFT_303051 [Sordaria sp. MPI-SDFR-AT-0083]|nr:hypothetical protein B0T09DRAFT_303051 [Sordaria sp. MPI-SDFR-AT-0083]
MSKRASTQTPQAGGLGKGKGSKGLSNVEHYTRPPGWRKPQCPRCAYRAAMVGRIFRKCLPSGDAALIRAFEIIGELACTAPVGQEQSGTQCNCCRTQDRGVEFHYPPGRGFEESSHRVWKSMVEFAGHCITFDAKPGLWETGLIEVEEASRDFLDRWNDVHKQYGKDLLQMSPQELKDMGCTSVVAYNSAGNPVEATATSSAGPRVGLDGVLDEVKNMENGLKQLIIEFRKHAENTKTEVEVINDTMGVLEADFAKLQIQDREAASMSDGQSEKLMKEIKELAQFVHAQGKVLSAVKIQVDRLAIKFSQVLSAAAPNTASTSEEESE